MARPACAGRHEHNAAPPFSILSTAKHTAEERPSQCSPSVQAGTKHEHSMATMKTFTYGNTTEVTQQK